MYIFYFQILFSYSHRIQSAPVSFWSLLFDYFFSDSFLQMRSKLCFRILYKLRFYISLYLLPLLNFLPIPMYSYSYSITPRAIRTFFLHDSPMKPSRIASVTISLKSSNIALLLNVITSPHSPGSIIISSYSVSMGITFPFPVRILHPGFLLIEN